MNAYEAVRILTFYRVSERIRRFALGIVNVMEIDDLDGRVANTVGGKDVSATSPSIIVA
jgi:hypothetical protein